MNIHLLKMQFKKLFLTLIFTALITAIIIVVSCGRAENSHKMNIHPDQLRQSFTDPPDNCRPEVMWIWMGGLISREGITADLESMSSVGIGGVMMMQLPDQCPYPRRWSYRDYPGKVKCLSDEWFEMANYAIGECDRLGLNFSLFMCPGWSHCGAPWITPEKGLKILVSKDTVIQGPQQFSATLPKSPAIIGIEGGNYAPEWSDDFKKQTMVTDPYYEDVVLLALPFTENDEVILSDDITDLSQKMTVDGKLIWEVPEGSWKLIRFGLASENGKNHPAPIEGSGLECDRMDPEAVQLVFDGIVGRIYREAKARGYHSFKGFETDSYEGGFQDFGKDFQEEFQRRRGYDCVSWLPAWLNEKLVINTEEITKRFRYDMLRTISELWAERFHGELRRLGDAHDLEWMTEPYGFMPINWRISGARSLKPGNEFWACQDQGFVGPASGIAALYDLDIVWAEAFTAEPQHSAWRNDPWVLKPTGDRAFSEGINHFYFHSFVHNPFNDRFKPGLTMGYWGTQFSRHLTWWPVSHGWHRYLSRCQYMLRQGLPVIDVLKYPQEQEYIPKEFGFTGAYRQVTLDDDAIMNMLNVKDGRITLPNGNSFAALVMNPNQPVRPEALIKIRELVKAGATLIGGPPPPNSPGLENYPDADREIKKLINEIWNEKNIGKEKVLTEKPAEKHLDDLLGGPDFQYSANAGDASDIYAMHRRTENTFFWFVAYSGDEELETNLYFRVSGLVPEFWDPVTGKSRPLPEYRQEGLYTVIPFTFFPRQSGFVVFTEPAGKKKPFPNGKNIPDIHTLVEIKEPWKVTFDPAWGGPVTPIIFNELEDWTSRPEKGIHYYSGIAAYSTNFDVPLLREAKGEGKSWIDLGKIKNLAQVKLNGTDLGYVWCAPWRVGIPADLMKESGNILEIKVANTWVNRLIGDEQEPEDCDIVGPDLWFLGGDRMGGYDEKTKGRGLKDLPDWLMHDQPRPSQGRYTFTSWRYYDHSAPLLPSGLIGPVRIITENP